MNEAVVLPPQEEIASPGLSDLLALVGLPSQRRSAKGLSGLSGSAGEILIFVDELLLKAISAQTRSEFLAARAEVFAPYVGAVTSLARLVRIVVPSRVIQRVLDESFCEVEAEFREQGLTRFGEAAKNQAIFTIWTLRRTSRLMSKIVSSGPVPDSLKEEDRALARKFSLSTAFTQFHLDCLLVAIRRDKPIQLDVMPEIIDGLRSAVNAYGYGREGLNLRVPEEEPQIGSYEWDEEDQELLDCSMREFETQTVDDSPPWSEQEAEAIEAKVINELKPIAAVDSKAPPISAQSSPAFGTHIREGIEIIKDWIEHPTPKQV